ncbi:MAG: uracil-DNA glycosylase [Caldiserica bacterium CG02_land_8_20_14_3_00_36_38]|nr:MAG: uracil-DNA glycosylase [Caldiserica bacterium CG02_land_8_20_14_3_00_36_38]PIW10813.1 MAG: uracil-DNA glycosylase [Caldiserica bacterium CG17_big_fil_post_rev_8_21_14_2_50_35_7]
MITESPPNDKADYFYEKGNPFYLQTIVQAFNDAGVKVSNMRDILNKGVYITTAIKCGKKDYTISLETIKNCSMLLEKEVSLFPNIKVFMLMGDVSIKAMNSIWKKQSDKRVIPVGSTYKTRKEKYYYAGKRVFPSYTPTGKNYLIEKAKQRMTTEDIKEVMRLI